MPGSQDLGIVRSCRPNVELLAPADETQGQGYAPGVVCGRGAGPPAPSAPHVEARASIALYDGPVALGFEEWEAIDLEFSVAQFQGILELLIATGDLPEQPVEPLARILVGGFNMAGRQIATAADPQRAVAEYGEVLRRLISGLADRPPAEP